MASTEHSEDLRLIARESRELKETVRALRSEIEKVRCDGEVRLQSAVDAANGEILHLRATIRRLRENLDAVRAGEHERVDTSAFEASAQILSLETAVKSADFEPERTHPQRDRTSIIDRPPFAGEHSVVKLAVRSACGELAELRETIVQLRSRLDRANVVWDEKMRAIESVGRNRRRKLEETIKILRERLQRASANG